MGKRELLSTILGVIIAISAAGLWLHGKRVGYDYGIAKRQVFDVPACTECVECPKCRRCKEMTMIQELVGKITPAPNTEIVILYDEKGAFSELTQHDVSEDEPIPEKGEEEPEE